MGRRKEVDVVDNKDVQNGMVREGMCVEIKKDRSNKGAEAEEEVYHTEGFLTTKKSKNMS